MSSYADMTHYYTDESPIGQVSLIVDVGRCPLTFPTPCHGKKSSPFQACMPQLQHAFRILVAELRKFLRTERSRKAIEKRSSIRIRAKRVIHGKQYAVDSEHLQRAAQRRLCEIPASRDLDVCSKIICNWLAELRHSPRENSAGSRHRIRQPFAHVSNDE